MSDLISRSELINKIRGIVPGSQDVDFIVRLIENQPTAYDVDKVVEELNQRKIKLLSYAEDYEKTGDFKHAEIYSHLAIEYTTAIKIVKQSGNGKDVNK